MRIGIATMVAAAGLSGCGPSPAPPSAPPIAAHAAPLDISGVSEVRLDTAVAEVRTALKPAYGDLGPPATYRLPTEIGFDALRAAYDAELKGWTPEPALERHVRGGEAAAWRSKGKVFAIALLPRPIYDRPTEYQALVTLASR